MTTELAEPLAALLDAVSLAPDRTSATVGDRTLRAATPAALERELGSALYEMFHAGREHRSGPVQLALHDADLVDALRRGVPHRHVEREVPLAETPERNERSSSRTRHDGAEPPKRAGDLALAGAQVLVSLGGVRVRLPAAAVATAPATGTARVTLSSCRPALSPGFFSVLGSREPQPGEPLLRVYAHLSTPSAALPAWSTALDVLERAEAAYRAKILALRSEYPRRDALVIYLGAGSWHACHDLAAVLHGLPGIAADTSDFALQLAPGIAAAWEPDDDRPSMRDLSFGQHRATVLAQALITTGPGGDAASVYREAATALRLAQIDPTAPYRNFGSAPLQSPNL
ncbi:T3SS effector HopA1 family protein [Kitasatospora sp. NPDC050463]|uniref:T3SS effector HopA1 family protein n=1 Tax=Kitasatospora sp. NPDC050463 TaxID=3155786 RepID=UPI0033C7B03B